MRDRPATCFAIIYLTILTNALKYAFVFGKVKGQSWWGMTGLFHFNSKRGSTRQCEYPAVSRNKLNQHDVKGIMKLQEDDEMSFDVGQ